LNVEYVVLHFHFIHMTLLQIASLIRNQISPFITNANIDINMLKDEIINTRNRLVYEYDLKKQLLSPEQLYVEINCIPVVCKDISECCDIDSDEKVLVAEIPELMQISSIPNLRYVGTIDRSTPFNLIKGNAYLYRKFAKWTSKMKAVWHREAKKQLVLYNYNTSIPPKYITVELIPKNEQEILKYECACINEEDVEFKCPDYLISVITEKLLAQYMSQYQMGHLQANTQSEIIGLKQ